jgi:transcriptional regulator with XRE-family HTH domain
MGDVVAVLLDDAMPAERLGELLQAARKRRGWKRKRAAATARITAAELRAYERGEVPVPADVCGRLIDCYGDDLTRHVPMRTPFAASDLSFGSERETLTSYAHLVQRLRNAKPGEPLSLRADDLAALAVVLDNDPETVEQTIVEILGCSRAEARSLHREILRRKIVVSVAGLAASAAAVAGMQAAAATNEPVHRVVELEWVSESPPSTAITLAPPKKTVAVPARPRRPQKTTTTTAPVMHPAPARHVPAEPRALPRAPEPVEVQDDGALGVVAPTGGQGGWLPLPEDAVPSMPRPSIPYDDTPVSVPPGETPSTYVGSATSTVPSDDAAEPCRCQAFSRTKVRMPASDIDTPVPE